MPADAKSRSNESRITLFGIRGIAAHQSLVILGIVDRPLAGLVFCPRIGPGGKKSGNDRRGAVPGGPVQRGPAKFVAVVWRGCGEATCDSLHRGGFPEGAGCLEVIAQPAGAGGGGVGPGCPQADEQNQSQNDSYGENLRFSRPGGCADASNRQGLSWAARRRFQSMRATLRHEAARAKNQ